MPAILRQVSDEQAMEMTIVENLQRTDLNPWNRLAPMIASAITSR